MFAVELALIKKGRTGLGRASAGVCPEQRVAGVDEAGRGPLAGPVVAAAVILDWRRPIAGLDDSKRLSARRREQLALEIETAALAWGIGYASVEEIDCLNILRASLLAMKRAVEALDRPPDLALVDGNMPPELECPVRTIVGGDRTVEVISAASILAKVDRDRHMEALEQRHPGYGLARHKGYPTRQHLLALAQHGVSACHRRSFRPVMRAADPDSGTD